MESTSNQSDIMSQQKSRTQDGSQTAIQYIDEQLALEADAKEILPFKFDKCTYQLGPMRQSLFACLTCSPPPASPAQVWTPAGVCYGCSISCHTEHNLVELFARRNFVCDCGTTRMPDSSPCNIRLDPTTNQKGVASQEAAKTNSYNQNFQNKFCGCQQEYDADTERGTMYQCLGLGTVETGGCGEDWWHPHCLMGFTADWPDKQRRVHVQDSGDRRNEISSVENDDEEEAPIPPGFPADEDFTSLICYKCVEANPWIKQYAGTKGFMPPLFYQTPTVADIAAQPSHVEEPQNLKRKASEDPDAGRSPSPAKRLKEEDTTFARDNTLTSDIDTTKSQTRHKHETLGPILDGVYSLLAKSDFREQLCHCPQCFPYLIPHPQLQEEEDEYEPSISDSERSIVDGGSAARSHGTGSLLERGEAALSTMDRVKAIEGVMVYNHLKDKVKEFLKPYAESGKAVGAEDIKAYFEKLRGDEAAIKEAGQRPTVDAPEEPGDKRREQGGQ